ncbi:MAG: hypothetical protein WCA35_05740 [Kovacikia sp.]
MKRAIAKILTEALAALGITTTVRVGKRSVFLLENSPKKLTVKTRAEAVAEALDLPGQME